MKSLSARVRGLLLAAVAGVVVALPTTSWAQSGETPLAALTPADGATRSPSGQDPFEGFDFGQVLKRIEASVDPLQREMHTSFKALLESVDESQRLLEKGELKPAIEKAVVAIDGVLLVKDRVLGPMWDGQQYLNDQSAKVRDRLARAMELEAGGRPVKLDVGTERLLDRIAGQISMEKDEWRQRRLIAHYRSVRQLAEIRTLASKLSPDQRKLWMSVLQVLQEASNTHFQLMLNSETLFAQFESTRSSLEGYLTLLETLRGASDVLGKVRGADATNAGIANIASRLEALQRNLGDLGSTMDEMVRTTMGELEGRIEQIQTERKLAAPGSRDGVDDELRSRMERVTGKK